MSPVVQQTEELLRACVDNRLDLIFTTQLASQSRGTYAKLPELAQPSTSEPEDVTPTVPSHATSHLVDAGVPLGTISDMLAM